MLDKLWSAPTEIVDYLFVMDCLKDYAKPRSKLSSLLKEGVLVRIKKGLYVIVQKRFTEQVSVQCLHPPEQPATLPIEIPSQSGEESIQLRTRMTGGRILRKASRSVRKKNGKTGFKAGQYLGFYPKEVLANLIYGPSYLSMQYALAYYGLIPERVMEVTSITCNRNKEFDTPLGKFSYRYLYIDKYAVGVTYANIDDIRGFLVATKEKALADLIARQSDLKTEDDISDYVQGLRIEPENLANFSLKKMREIAKIYKNHQVNLLKDLLIKYHEHSKRSRQKAANKKAQT